MIRIEAVAQNGIPTKHEPFILTDKENEYYWDNLKEEITSLETYEDLDECKKTTANCKSFLECNSLLYPCEDIRCI